MSVNLPKKISPDPIVDSVVELRFTNAVPSEAVFGMVFSCIQKEFSKFQKLPAAQLPSEILEKDENLKFAPTHEARSGGYVFRVGPRVLSLANPDDYFGWDNYFARLRAVLGAIESSGVIGDFSRLGIRYIDFFELDVFEKVILSITKNGQQFDAKQKSFSALVGNGKFDTMLRIANNVDIKAKGAQKSGSIIDSDTFRELPSGTGFPGLLDLMDECHQASKEVFFSLLREDFVATLRPEY